MSKYPHVVIVGADSMDSESRAFGSRSAHVTLIDRHDYHTFQPLLYQVATSR